MQNKSMLPLTDPRDAVPHANRVVHNVDARSLCNCDRPSPPS